MFGACIGITLQCASVELLYNFQSWLHTCTLLQSIMDYSIGMVASPALHTIGIHVRLHRSNTEIVWVIAVCTVAIRTGNHETTAYTQSLWDSDQYAHCRQSCGRTVLCVELWGITRYLPGVLALLPGAYTADSSVSTGGGESLHTRQPYMHLVGWSLTCLCEFTLFWRALLFSVCRSAASLLGNSTLPPSSSSRSLHPPHHPVKQPRTSQPTLWMATPLLWSLSLSQSQVSYPSR